MSKPDLANIGIIGTSVMGKNLALNIADHGFSVAVWNRAQDVLNRVVAESGGKLHGQSTLEKFVTSLERPRKIIMMIKAGAPVDDVLTNLVPVLEEGDIVIDGGNSWFLDTQRRQEDLAKHGIQFFGMGISGGEEGARHGPALMPGGELNVYAHLRPVLEAIAAKTESGPCVTHCGNGGAGHFVKMVHNGIEYADMQLIAEAYDLLRRLVRLEPPELAEIFAKWNQGPLESYLIEITSKIFTVPDPKGGYLIDQVLDKAGQKGTGRWTVEAALKLGVPIPSITAAVDARILSSMKHEREYAGQMIEGSTQIPQLQKKDDKSKFAQAVHGGLHAAKICAYAQGMALIQVAAKEYHWATNLREVAKGWKGGCIIRARFLDTVMRAYERNVELTNLLLDTRIRQYISEAEDAWRKVVNTAQKAGVPVPGFSASLAYYDSYRSARLPQNLTQAQRDAFGAHTYQRTDDPDGNKVHSEWLGSI